MTFAAAQSSDLLVSMFDVRVRNKHLGMGKGEYIIYINETKCHLQIRFTGDNLNL